ncbi:insulinase family protein [Halosquirtibacter xylanolyticus]|uniref:M16 family metallopeptidase n=1 Tax=Halosquirtibacter xylanolyticus TaxID=3374599 RepID=UPI003749B827|nr:insulinase family protein [Prolixibacteraceae bacterium]
MTHIRRFKYLILFSITLLYCSAHHVSAAKQNYLKADNKEISYDVITNKSEDNKASLAIFFDKGANTEMADEKGFTHCLEHMMFQGTTNFPKDSIIRYNESMGGKVGLTFNAYTGASGVTLKIENITLKDNKIPDAYFIFLSDIINNLTLDETTLEEQKKIITEELLLKDNKENKTIQAIQFWKTPDAKEIKESFVLGTQEQIKNITKDKLETFYTKWIKNCNINIVAIGDIDDEETSDKIETYFANVNYGTIFTPIPVSKYKRYDDYPIQVKEFPYHTELYKITSDIPIFIDRTGTDIDIVIKERLLNALLTRRFLTWRKDLSKYYYAFEMQPETSQNGIEVNIKYIPTLGKEIEMHKHLLARLNELYQKGFTASEMRTAKQFIDYSLSHNYIEISNSSILSYYEYYLRNRLVYYSDKELHTYFTVKRARYNVKDINPFFISKANTTPTYLYHIGKTQNKVNLEEVKYFYSSPKDKSIESKNQPKASFDRIKFEKAQIIHTDTIDDQNITIWSLSNNMKVVYKYIKSYTNTLYLNAYKKQTETVLDNLICYAMNQNYGLQNKDFYDELKGYTLQFISSPEYAFIYARIHKTSINKVFQMLTERQNPKNFTVADFEKMKKEYIQHIENFTSIETQIIETADQLTNTKHIAINHELKEIPKVSYHDFMDRYQKHFTDFNNYEFQMIGDIKPKAMRRLIKQYLAMIPKSEKQEISANHISENITQPLLQDSISIKSDLTKQSHIKYRIVSPLKYSLTNKMCAYIYCEIMEQRFSKKLRAEHQLVYTANTGETFLNPFNQTCEIDFDITLQNKNKYKASQLMDLEQKRSITKEEFDIVMKQLEEPLNDYHKDISNFYKIFFNRYFTDHTSYKTPIDIQKEIEQIDYDTLLGWMALWKGKERIIKVYVN